MKTFEKISRTIVSMIENNSMQEGDCFGIDQASFGFPQRVWMQNLRVQ